jgi:hypothetical protein
MGGAYNTQNFDASYSWHHLIEQDQVAGFAGNILERATPINSDIHSVTTPPKTAC